MSADNYYTIRRHPDGGYAAVMAFVTDTEDPHAHIWHHPWPTVEDARDWAISQLICSVHVHPECRWHPKETIP